MNHAAKILAILGGVSLIVFGVYAALSGELKSRTGKPTPEGFAQIYGVVLAGFGVYVIIQASNTNSKD